MNDHIEVARAVTPKPMITKATLTKARWAFGGLSLGLIVGAWIGGGPDRYGDHEGVLGGLRGAGRTLTKGTQYTAAMLQDCFTAERSSVRKIGLGQQIETRLWQDKRLVADGIVVEVGDGGTAVLKGIVPDQDHKDKAVTLARDTRGVERVVDELAIRPSARTIVAVPSAAVPTGVAADSRVLR